MSQTAGRFWCINEAMINHTDNPIGFISDYPRNVPESSALLDAVPWALVIKARMLTILLIVFLSAIEQSDTTTQRAENLYHVKLHKPCLSHVRLPHSRPPLSCLSQRHSHPHSPVRVYWTCAPRAMCRCIGVRSIPNTQQLNDWRDGNLHRFVNGSFDLSALRQDDNL